MSLFRPLSVITTASSKIVNINSLNTNGAYSKLFYFIFVINVLNIPFYVKIFGQNLAVIKNPSKFEKFYGIDQPPGVECHPIVIHLVIYLYKRNYPISLIATFGGFSGMFSG